MSENGAQPARGGAVRGAARLVQDAVTQASGVSLVILCLIVFAAAVVGGLSLIGPLGIFGWIAYAVVLCVLALALGPSVATGVTLRQKGSVRHREEAARRLHEQRRKFGLESTFGESQANAASGDRPRQPEARATDRPRQPGA